MSAERNPFASIPTGMTTTASAAEFVENITFDAIPA